MPAGEFAPLAPVLEPWLEGAVVDGSVVEGAIAGGFCMVSELSYVSCAIAPTEPIAVRAIVAAAAFQIFISNLLLVEALREGKPELSPLGSREMPPGVGSVGNATWNAKLDAPQFRVEPVWCGTCVWFATLAHIRRLTRDRTRGRLP
jgi:hypothetical protein